MTDEHCAEHQNNSSAYGDSLLDQKAGGIGIGAGGIDHDQSEDIQKKDGDQYQNVHIFEA